MAPSKRRRGAASKSPRSVEAAAGTPPRRDADAPERDDRDAAETDGAQQEPKAPPPNALVLGVPMWVPQTFDPDTYNPDGQRPRTPEAEAAEPESYSAWGRERFGNDWFEQRRTMLQERNIYVITDRVYQARQRALRVLEHTTEGRPFRPYVQHTLSGDGTSYGEDNLQDKGWRRLWARLSPPSVENPSTPPASPPPDDDGGDTDLDGYNTYPPTPEPREATPFQDDPFERLERKRRLFQWDDEQHQFEKVFLQEQLIDEARTKREDEDGNKRREKELEEIQSLRQPLLEDPDERWRRHGEYERRMGHFRLREQGWTQQQIDTKDREDAEEARRWDEAKASEPSTKTGSVPITPKELDEIRSRWDASGTSKERQAQLIQIMRLDVQPSGGDEVSENGLLSPPRASTDRPAKGISNKTRGGRVGKSRQDRGRKANASSTRIPTAAATHDVQPKRKRAPPASKKAADDAASAPGQRRASRRLQGQTPEYGLLPEGKAPPAPRQTSAPKGRKAGARGGGPQKKPAAPGAKPQGVVKPTPKKGGAGRPKRQ